MLRTIEQTIFILVVSIALGLVVNAFSKNSLPLLRPPDERIGKWRALTAEETLQRMEEGAAILVDARDAKYFKEGHIPGALNLPASTFGDAFAEMGDALPRDFPLIVYCQGSPCDESHEVLERLEILEFTELLSYEGGWLEWEQREFPVEKSEE